MSHQDVDIQTTDAGSDPGALGNRGGRVAVWRTLAVVAAALLVMVSTGWLVTAVRDDQAPAQSSPEVGFARDMFSHHEQAVTMSFLVKERTNDPIVDVFAQEIAQNQASQQGRMLAWLDSHDVAAVTGRYQPMEWMTGAPNAAVPSGSGHRAHSTGTARQPTSAPTASPAVTMMGMATDEELSELGRLSGREAEVHYLELMYRHHEGGLAMAQAYLDVGNDRALTRLAQAIVSSQRREMAIITDLLAQRR